jgi:hypothetical protein
VSSVRASGVGGSGICNCPFPQDSGTFTLTQGSGDSGWDSVWNDCSACPEPR